MQYSVVIPTLHAGKGFHCLLDALLKQTIHPEIILVVDSQSDDDTVQQAKEYKCVRLIEIKRSDFDHGGTRNFAFKECNTPVVVMMTQDALPVDSECMENLLAPLMDERVAAVCARQVAKPEAKLVEKVVREFRYPETRLTWSKDDTQKLGIRSYLLSDVCTAYRRSAYNDVGGFESPIITNEDMLIAADFLDAGYRLAYQSEACVWHSHQYSLWQEYQRNYLIGAFLARYGYRFDTGEMSEGIKMVRFVTCRLFQMHRVKEIIPFWFDCVARFLGTRAGKRDERRRKW